MLSSIRELLRSPGLRSKISEDDLAFLEDNHEDTDSLLTSVLQSSSLSLQRCGGAASRRNLIMGQIVSWGEVSQRLLTFLVDNDYKPRNCDCDCAGGHESPLRVACHVGNRLAITTLMPLRLFCDTAESLLEAAVTAGQLDIVQLLIQSGEIEVKSVGLKLLAIAIEHEHLAIGRYLLRRGVPLSPSLVTQQSSLVGQLLCTLTESENDEEAVANFKSGTSTVSLKWKSLSLAGIQESWLTANLLTVTELDVSKNQLLSLPGIIFTHLKSLRKLNASHNSLSGIGSDSTVVQATS